MRWITGFVAIVLVVWCGWWFLGRALILGEAEKLIASERAGGATVEMSSFGVEGFPGRFDLTAMDPRYRSAGGDTGWHGDFLRLYAMSWKPWHLILALPRSQTLMIGGTQVAITSETLQASLRARPRAELPLAEMRLTGSALELSRPEGQNLALEDISLALREAQGITAAEAVAAGYSYQFGLQLRGLRPDQAFLTALAARDLPEAPSEAAGLTPPPAPLPEKIDLVQMNLLLTLSAPLDRFAAETKPQLSAIDLREASLTWGDLHLLANGKISADSNGFAAGNITVKARGWQHLPPVLVAAGLVGRNVEPLLGNMLRALEGAGNQPGEISLPLNFKDGRVSFGPFPLGPAPRLTPIAGPGPG